MKRILLLVTLALMLAAAMALSGVAQAKPISGKADVQCLQLAIKTLGPSFNPGTYNFVGGTAEGEDLDARRTEGQPDVFCGFGGGDSVSTLEAGDIFLGGEGGDLVIINNGTFYGGAGNDRVDINTGGATFYGGEGDDSVTQNNGTFNGGDGTDFVGINRGGTLISVELGDV